MSDPVGRLISGAYRARRALARAIHPLPVPDDPRARTLSEDGIVVLPGALPAPALARAAALAEERFSLKDPARLAFSPDGRALLEAEGADRAALERFYFLHIKNFQREYDVYRDIIPVVDPILRAYYRSYYRVRDAACYRTQPIASVQGSYEWHRDNYPPGCLKVMTYLTPVLSKEDGPLTVAAGTAAGFVPELGRVGDRYSAETVAGRRLVDALGPAGTVIVFDNNAIHRATDPARGRRDVINFTVFPSVTPPDPAEVVGLDLEAEATWLKKYTR